MNQERDLQVQRKTRVLSRFKFQTSSFNPNSPFSIGNVAYIANLSKKINEKTLKIECEKYGDVEAVEIVLDPMTK